MIFASSSRKTAHFVVVGAIFFIATLSSHSYVEASGLKSVKTVDVKKFKAALKVASNKVASKEGRTRTTHDDHDDDDDLDSAAMLCWYGVLLTECGEDIFDDYDYDDDDDDQCLPENFFPKCPALHKKADDKWCEGGGILELTGEICLAKNEDDCCVPDAGPIAGMSIGIILFIVLINVLICWCCKCCCFRKKEVIVMQAPPATVVQQA